MLNTLLYMQINHDTRREVTCTAESSASNRFEFRIPRFESDSRRDCRFIVLAAIVLAGFCAIERGFLSRSSQSGSENSTATPRASTQRFLFESDRGRFRRPACECLERPSRLSPRPRNFDPRRGSLYCRRRSRHVEDDAHTHASARARARARRVSRSRSQRALRCIHGPTCIRRCTWYGIMHIATRASL